MLHATQYYKLKTIIFSYSTVFEYATQIQQITASSLTTILILKKVVF